MSKKTNEIRRKIKEKEEKYKRKLTYKEVKRIEKDVLKKYNRRKKIAGIFLALGITTVGGATAGLLLASGSNDVPENAKKTEATIENSEKTDTSKKTNDFKENLQTLTYSQITEEIAHKYMPEDKSVYDKKEIEKIDLPEESEYTKKIKYAVNRRDIDINGHMHNLYYLDLAYEALPEEVYNQRPYDSVQIQYKKEIKYGENVICKYAYYNDYHVVAIYTADEKNLHAIVKLK